MDAFSKSNGSFAVVLLKSLCQDTPGCNVCVSPLSVTSALATILLGARGSTKAQIAKMLSLKEKKDHQSFQLLLSKVNNLEGQYVLKTASRLYGEISCNFCSPFKEECSQLYQAELEELSFIRSHEEARGNINNWVSRNTEGKIQELLPCGSVSPLTNLVLVNAIYFKGQWRDTFDKAYTVEVPFKINQKEQVPVQMMFQESTFNLAYIDEVEAQLLELPYIRQELSMFILLPDENVDLRLVEKQLTFEKFRAWTKLLKSTKVEVSLPRFRLAEDYQLESVLPTLGMVNAFQIGQADFSAMAEDLNLHLSTFVHKVCLEVNEDGTEAAAASGLLIEVDCGAEMPQFYADHPFLFFLIHNDTKSILFCGRFCSP
ncbi:serpin B9-like [Suncus etruscus]|uniref:serpin B9-like n=1 Tax=Suncus etruscus TaxID=109475 RepID=UPI00210F83A5|nr:serpin B9-like [Suncus etruscus]